MDKYTGKKLDGRYEIRELIGVGGMANVYHCYDTIDAREVAIKILKDEFLDNEDFIRRFKNESKAIAVLNHPNIVRVYDVSFGDMIQYIVMEYIDGITLKEYIDMQKVLDWKETVHLTTQILKALQHAHENGIVHRDIKPHNIMLLQDGTIKVTDFGIARFSSNATRTMTEQAIGSVHYIAPEQARGEKTDGKTDIYSVGVMMYEMLTGTLPFDGDSAVTVALMQLQAKAKRPREINPDIPEGLEEITMKAMQKNPEDRYHSAVEMLSDIERFRLNPSILFHYTYHTDLPPADDVPEEDSKRDYEDPEADAQEVYYDEDVPVRSPVLSAIKGIILAAVIALVVFGGVAAYQGYVSAQPKEIEVPDFTNMTLSEANAKNNGKFNFSYISRYSDDIPVDTIIEQSPAGGSKKMKEGSTIELVVNSADTYVAVPYINGALGTEQIQATIEKVNLVPKILYVESEQTAQKIDGVYPPTGTQVKIGSPVYVYVSKGVTKPKLVMPDIKGYSAEKAVAALKEAGFTNYSVEYDDRIEAEKDEVVRQNPMQGSEVVSDYGITVVCSKGTQKEKKVNIEVDLPSDVTTNVSMKVLVDGAVDSENSKDVVPSYNPKYKITVKVKDDATIVVLLDDQQYREYKVDYANNSVSLVNSYPYTPKETEAPATQAPVEEVEETPSNQEEQGGSTAG
ncbi:Stk1 family PASTA domain-containing Ser/Thr kinase [Ruminococcus sp.]|uniref:Stk1 family PASTA domain-containing Ser/Thr kinase n=2 Tax=Ruminococcus sp. TaxID=41978 RepID=UPI002E800459|nr:Stk1 family PASTA domain-containing Ser/Thr kinase [Ruminococcus sp.]MEE3492191.1 Stk1 family PASTA domain-containing Ser/Thr kinase [Ruminococcus sp.]